GVTSDEPFVVATDARRREVYWAAYDADHTRTAGPDVGVAATIVDDERVGRRPAAGAGARQYADAFEATLGPEYPSGALLADAVAIGAVTPTEPVPLYLRRPDVAVAAERKRVLG